VDLHNKLIGEAERRVPHLLDERQAVIGLPLVLTADGLAFGEARTDG
jgi:hypothetical protein